MTMKKTKSRGLFYCQYLVGIGHLVRSLNICRCLIKEFEIDFLQGGQDVQLSLPSPAFHPIQLPPIEGSNLVQQEASLERLFKTRQGFINQLDAPYDFLITELFPFSKWDFKEEVLSLINHVKKNNPQCLILCSLRDSFVQNPLAREKEILEIISCHYDAVFVHSDPRVFKLEESFSLAQQLAGKVSYTGFIVHPETHLALKREKRIVTSLGEGAFGEELMDAVLKVAPEFPDYQFVFIMGPKSPPSLASSLKQKGRQLEASNIRIHPFVENFPEFLSASALSISLGGYTIMDAVFTKTPALVIPSKFLDQYVRGLKFQAFGFIRLLTDQQLDPPSLKNAIQQTLQMPIPLLDIDMSGAQTTTDEIRRLVNKKLNTQN
jgi:predicted glycosyltransferase